MKKTINRIKINSLLIMLVLLVLTGCASKPSVKPADMKGYEGFATEHRFLAVSIDSFIEKIETKEKGVYFIGYPTNGTSNSLAEILNEISESREIDIYYLDMSSSKINTAQRTRLDELSQEIVSVESLKGTVPVVYIVNNGYRDAIIPNADGLSINDRRLTSEERDNVYTEIDQLIYD